MSDTKQQMQERSAIFSDYYNNKLPKRLPVSASIPLSMVAAYGGLDPITYQYDFSMLSDASAKLCAKIYSDSCPLTPPSIAERSPSLYQLLDSQNFVLGANGQLQHPEVSGMNADEYPELTEKGFDFLVETVIPRVHKNLDISDPIKSRTAFEMAKTAMNHDTAGFIPVMMQLIEQFGYYPGPPPGSISIASAPMDFVADQLRGFTGMSKDLRRNIEWVKEASEAMLPLMFAWARTQVPHPEGGVIFPLHMPTFIREKDFLKAYLPTFKTLLEQLVAVGVRPIVACEDDWSRYLDIIKSEFPAGIRLVFEYGDPKTIKDKLGDKFFITGLFPLENLRTATPETIADRAKEFLDIMLPGGVYLFGFDKDPLGLSDVNIETWAALNNFLKEYMVCDHAGESFGTPMNAEGFVRDTKAIPEISSKYLFNWEEFKSKYPMAPDVAKINFEQINHDLFVSYMNLLV